MYSTPSAHPQVPSGGWRQVASCTDALMASPSWRACAGLQPGKCQCGHLVRKPQITLFHKNSHASVARRRFVRDVLRPLHAEQTAITHKQTLLHDAGTPSGSPPSANCSYAAVVAALGAAGAQAHRSSHLLGPTSIMLRRFPAPLLALVLSIQLLALGARAQNVLNGAPAAPGRRSQGSRDDMLASLRRLWRPPSGSAAGRRLPPRTDLCCAAPFLQTPPPWKPCLPGTGCPAARTQLARTPMPAAASG